LKLFYAILFLFFCVLYSCCSSKKQISKSSSPNSDLRKDTLTLLAPAAHDERPRAKMKKPMPRTADLDTDGVSDRMDEVVVGYGSIKKKQNHTVVLEKNINRKIKSVTETEEEQPKPQEENKVSNETSGLLKYNIPPNMNFREIYTIHIRINRDKTDDKAIAVDMGGNTKTKVIRTSETMEVLVTDPAPADRKNFDIEKSDADKQLVETDKGEFTEWIFDVTPLHTGKLKLNVTVSIIRNGEKKQVVYFHSVTVKATKWSLFQYWWRKNWQWCSGALLIPLFFLLLKYRLDKKPKI